MDETMTNFYEIVSSADSLDLYIKWKVNEIAGSNNANGIILQHMNMESHISCLRSISYWEMWEVVDSKISGNECGYDDKWSSLPSFLIHNCDDDIAQSSDGIVKFTSKVYWIPWGCDAYKEVIEWDVGTVPEASELKSSLALHSNVEKYYIFDRYHEWNYKTILCQLLNKQNR